MSKIAALIINTGFGVDIPETENVSILTIYARLHFRIPFFVCSKLLLSPVRMALGVSKNGLRFIPFEPETVYTVVGKSVEPVCQHTELHF